MSREFFTSPAFETEVGPLVQGDLLSARRAGRGTYKDGFPGATAESGTEVVFRGNDILRGADGRFTEYWVGSDGQYPAQQLGAG